VSQRAYYPDTRWLASSQFLRCDAAPTPVASVSIAQRASLPPGPPSMLAPLMTLIGR